MAGSGVGYDPIINGKVHSFGVSGKLYKANVLLYDHQSESLWSQILKKAVTGPKTGTQLETFPLIETTWKDWKVRQPRTQVLSPQTGYKRPYLDGDPYGIRSEKALGVVVGSETRAYPFGQLRKTKNFPIKDRVGDQTVLVYFDKKTKKAWATNESEEPLDSVLTFLGVWKSFYPRSKIFKAK